jgi:hypothetical protein
MKDILEYIISDSRCESAIQEYSFSESTEEWVYKNIELFNTISIRVDGLPSIASCNYQGRHFENIKEFHSFFRKAMEVIDDPFDEK